MHIPFVDKGRDWHGVDCWGLARLIYEQEKKILLPSYDECYKNTLDRGLGTAIPEGIPESDFIERGVNEKPQEFDIVLLRQAGIPMHVGIVTKPNHMIHCYHGLNTVHEKFTGMRWHNKVVGFFHYEQ